MWRRRGLTVFGASVAVLAAAVPATVDVSAAAPLAGIVVGIDPGHNGRNYAYPSYLSRQVWNGREWEDCDTTGTSTAGGYTEARFNWNVAVYLRADLVKLGARVVTGGEVGGDGVAAGAEEAVHGQSCGLASDVP